MKRGPGHSTRASFLSHRWCVIGNRTEFPKGMLGTRARAEVVRTRRIRATRLFGQVVARLGICPHPASIADAPKLAHSAFPLQERRIAKLGKRRMPYSKRRATSVARRLFQKHDLALECSQRMKEPRLGHALLLSSSAVTGFTALPAGDTCLFTSPLMGRSPRMGGPTALSGDISLLLGVHGCEPPQSSGHQDTSLHPCTE